MATGSASRRISEQHPHYGGLPKPQPKAGTDLLLFTGKRPKWAIIGALKVMTMDWQDF